MCAKKRSDRYATEALDPVDPNPVSGIDLDAELEELLTQPRFNRAAIPKTDYLSLGSTLLNLCCSGMPDCGITKGRFFWIVGDSSSGKTFLCLTCFAEATIDPNWKEYDLFFDNVEDGALMDIERYFGKKLAKRIKAPRYSTTKKPIYSETAEDFYFTLDDKLKAVESGKAPPFLYLLDSMDALSTNYEGAKFKEKKTAARGGPKAKGDYGDGKAKVNSTHLRGIVSRLRKTGSTLIVLSQTRDNVDGGLFDPKSVVAGGRAMKFYATWQLWSSRGAALKKLVNGIERQIGLICKVTVKKNRLTGKEWSVEVPIYHSHGFDDVGSCVDFLLKEKHWETSDGTIKVTEFGWEGKRDQLIKKVESEGLEPDLRDLVFEVWKDIEKRCQIDRKRRYN